MGKMSIPYLWAAFLVRCIPLSRCIADDKYLRIVYRGYMGKKLNLNHPKSFNEKLQWLKLYDRNPEYIRMVDKYEAKKYVAGVIGEQYIVPNLGVWDSFDEIDFDTLPQKFVLKCTHDSAGIVICKDKQLLNYNVARKKINRALKKNFYYRGREWPYKDIRPRIIAEQFLDDKVKGGLRDYKFFCFDGVAKFMFIASDRFEKLEETKFDFFDMEFNFIDVRNGHPNSIYMIQKPVKFEEMRVLAEKLSKNIPQVRIDFYEVEGKVYFGEMTFSHWSGFTPFEPEEWDDIFGEYITLPKKTDKENL